MSFVTGWLAIAGIAAASIPIIIHLLLRRRRKPVMWAAMALLLEATRRQRRRTKLEQIILLALRCLLLALLGISLAQPLLSGKGVGRKSRIIHMVIDDGIVSGLQDEADGRTALERHAQDASRFIENLDSSDRITVTLAARPVRMLINEPSADHRSVVRALGDLVQREGATDYVAAMNLVGAQLQEPGVDHDIMVMSDFRSGSVNLDDQLPKLEVIEGSNISFLATPPTDVVAGNVQVESIQLARNPASAASAGNVGLVQVTVRLRRTGDKPEGRSTIRLEGDAIEPVSPRSVEWTAGREEAKVEFQARVDADGGTLRAVLDLDRLPADDQRLMSVESAGPIQVLLVDRSGIPGMARLDRLGVTDWVERALDPIQEQGGLGAMVRTDRVDPASLEPRDLEDATILVLARPDLIAPEMRSRIADYARNGGVVVLVPPTEVVAQAWASPLLMEMDIPWSVSLEPETLTESRPLATQQPDSSLLQLLSGELPQLAPAVTIDQRLQVDGWSDAEAVLLDELGEAVVLSSPIGAGQLIFFATAPVLEWTDLPVKPLVVPLFHEIVRQGSAMARRSVDGVVGERSPLVRSPSAVAMLDESGQRISRGGGGRFDPPTRSGSFTVVDLAETPIEKVVVNPAIDSANVDLLSVVEIKDWFAQAGDFKILNEEETVVESGVDPTNDIAVQLLMLVAILLLVETIAARYFSKAAIRGHASNAVRSTGSAGKQGIVEPTS